MHTRAILGYVCMSQLILPKSKVNSGRFGTKIEKSTKNPLNFGHILTI